METARVVDKKTVCEGNYLRFVRIRYADSSGAVREWEAFERINCKGIVAIVPVTEKGEVLLIRQFRPPVNGHVIEFPAGLNDRGETLEEAAKRELLEETGYEAGYMTYLTEGPLSSGASGEVLTVYLARGLKFKGIVKRDETEDIEVLKVPIRDLPRRLSSCQARGDYVDLKITGLLDLASRHL